MDTVTIIVSIAGAFGLGNVVPLIVNKFFSRKVDKVSAIEASENVSNLVMNNAEQRVKTLVTNIEKLNADCMTLLSKLQKVYRWTCAVEDCSRRELLCSSDCAVNLLSDES